MIQRPKYHKLFYTISLKAIVPIPTSATRIKGRMVALQRMYRIIKANNWNYSPDITAIGKSL